MVWNNVQVNPPRIIKASTNTEDTNTNEAAFSHEKESVAEGEK